MPVVNLFTWRIVLKTKVAGIGNCCRE